MTNTEQIDNLIHDKNKPTATDILTAATLLKDEMIKMGFQTSKYNIDTDESELTNELTILVAKTGTCYIYFYDKNGDYEKIRIADHQDVHRTCICSINPKQININLYNNAMSAVEVLNFLTN